MAAARKPVTVVWETEATNKGLKTYPCSQDDSQQSSESKQHECPVGEVYEKQRAVGSIEDILQTTSTHAYGSVTTQ